MSRKQRPFSKRRSSSVVAQSVKMELAQCCVFNEFQEWKIVPQSSRKPTKRFINLTIGEKKSSQKSFRCSQSKQTCSRSLSKQSSRQMFQKAKKDFMQQLKMWNPEDSNISIEHRPFISTEETPIHHPNHQRLNQNLIFDQNEASFYEMSGKMIKGSNKKSEIRWMTPDLKSIEEVEINFETSEGLNTQNSMVLEKSLLSLNEKLYFVKQFKPTNAKQKSTKDHQTIAKIKNEWIVL